MHATLSQIIPNKLPGKPLEGWILIYKDGSQTLLHKDKPIHLQADLIKQVRDYQRTLVWQLMYARDIREWSSEV